MQRPDVTRILHDAQRQCPTLDTSDPTYYVGIETVVVVLLKHLAPSMAFGTVYLLGVLLVGMAWGFGLASITALVSAVAFDICRSWPESRIACT